MNFTMIVGLLEDRIAVLLQKGEKLLRQGLVEPHSMLLVFELFGFLAAFGSLFGLGLPVVELHHVGARCVL